MRLPQTILWTFAFIFICDAASFEQSDLFMSSSKEHEIFDQAAARMKRSAYRKLVFTIRTLQGARFHEEMILNPGCSSFIVSYTALLTVTDVKMEDSVIGQANLNLSADLTVKYFSGQQSRWSRIVRGTYDFVIGRMTIFPPEGSREYLIQECDFVARGGSSCQGRLLKRNGEVCSTYQMTRIV